MSKRKHFVSIPKARIDLIQKQQDVNILREVMLVIKYCHDMGVVHRDNKPAIVIVNQLLGFNYSVQIQHKAEPWIYVEYSLRIRMC